MEKVCVCNICCNIFWNMCNINFIGIRDMRQQRRDMDGYVYVLDYYLSDMCSYASVMTIYIRFDTFRFFAKSIMHNVTSPKTIPFTNHGRVLKHFWKFVESIFMRVWSDTPCLRTWKQTYSRCQISSVTISKNAFYRRVCVTLHIS
jgi:hypothetical protein